MMNTVLDRECFIILSEGFADRNFLHQLTSYALPELPFSFPFPTSEFYSVSMMNRMLSAIRADKVGLPKVMGIFLVADSCDNPVQTFNQVGSEIRKANWGAVPAEIGEVAFHDAEFPPIAVLTLPSSVESGGLETLFARELSNRLPILAEHAERFLFSDHTDVADWNVEKQGKAKYASLIAASHRDDPSRAASSAFRRPAAVDIRSAIFEPLVVELRRICTAMTSA